MFSGIVSLAVAKEVATANLDSMKIADQYFVKGTTYTVTYDVSSRGTIQGDLEEFRKIVAETYADERGWQRAGVTLKEVPSGGQLHVVLASGEEVKKVSPSDCSEELSCRVGRYVLVNDARWMNATESYTQAGISLSDYRQMVINHETGHYLGHDHVECDTAVGVGSVMLQQSTGLRGCAANSWPLPNELWVKGL